LRFDWQALYLGGNYRKASASLTRTSGFDRCIESKKVRLAGDRADQGNDITDLLRHGHKSCDKFVGPFGLFDSCPRNTTGFGDPAHQRVLWVRSSRLTSGDVVARKACLSSVVDATIVSENKIRIIGSNDNIRSAFGPNGQPHPGFVNLFRNGAPRPMKMGNILSP
jgi:hypothetical protein